ncbi:MAG TPA: NADH-quinone oxidoreductase subunit N [Chitinophagales bacterium]|nr:NADH-quinone oxidoreductase subunit N [Chitinophagales bacterium]
MDTLIFKSFLPEIFFSLATLIQVVLNTKVINDLKYNFPIIDREVFYQTVFVLILFIIFQNDLKIEGILGTNTLANDSTIRVVKQLFCLFAIFALVIVNEAHLLQKLNFTEFYFILSLSVFSLIIMISCSDLLIFYLLMEMQALCFYVLAAFNRNSIFSVEGGIKYFISGAFISGFYLLGVSFLYGSLGTISLNNLQSILSFDLSTYNENLVYLLYLSITLITSTLLFKIACAPFHFWSPDVYDGAPLSSTIVFSIIPKIPLFFFFMKWLNSISVVSEELSTILVFFGVLSVFVGTFFALGQKRLKRLIVFSSVAQTGFLVSGIGLLNLEGYSYTFFFLGLYVLTSILIWGHFVLFHSYSNRTNYYYNKELTSLYISTISNLFKDNVLWALSLVIIFFSIAGIPPLSGFLSKMLIIYNLINQQNVLFAVALVLISSVSVYYYIRILKVAYFEPKKENSSEDFKTIYMVSSLDFVNLMIPVLLSILILLFYSPSFFLLLSQYTSFGGFIY